MEKKDYPLLNLSCASCAAKVQKTLQETKGVSAVAVNLASAKAHIEFDSSVVTAEQLQKAVQDAGFGMVIEEPSEELNNNIEQAHIDKYSSLKRRTTWAIVLSIPLVVIAMFAMHHSYANYAMLILATPILAIFGRNFFIGAWKQLKHKSANMDTLVALSTSVAYIFSLFNTFYPSFWTDKGLKADVYYEAAAVIITFILIGKLLEERAKGNTSAAIRNLMGLQPKTVTIIDANGNQVETAISKVKVGDKLLVRAGEKIAVDGKVESGSSFVDESMISGESFPSEKNEGSEVFAGTINQKGSFRFIADKVGDKTVLAQIIKVVQQAQGSRAPVQKHVDKIAAIFVPTVIVLALITLAVWVIFGGENNLSQGILSLVTVLIIACPCALGLATPTAIMVGMGKGATEGILIKDAEALETAKKITAIVLDKTGTITEGKLSVVDVWWNNNIMPDEKLFDLIYNTESSSDHPMSLSIKDYLKKNVVNNYTLTTQNIAGAGITAQLDGVNYYSGNEKLLASKEIRINSKQRHWIDEQLLQARSLSFFANDEQVLAIFAVSDSIKPTSIDAIASIKKLGIKVFMFTGDNEKTAAAVAKKVGIDNYKSGGLPSEKADFIKELQAKGEIVAMVGDGINDSGALATANVSIAMGKGSDIAMDVAKMTIISSDLNKIPEAIKLSKKVVSTIKENLFWAFIYNLIGIPIAAGILYPLTGFLLNPMIAGAAMALSSICVVTNSLMRLK